MSQVKPAGSYDNDQAMLLIVFGGFAFLAWLWFNKFVLISCTALYWIWRMADFHLIHAFAASRINLLANTANNADNITGHQLLAVLNQTSGILFIFLIPMLVAGVIGMIGNPALPFRSKRTMNIHTLPRVMARFSPAIVPILADSLSPDLLMNDDRPEHRWGMHPEEFAEKYGLIETRVLNREKTGATFIAQLGPHIENHSALRDYEKALFTIFGLQLFFNDRKAAKQLLDQLNRSCLGKASKGKSALLRPNFSVTEKLFAKVWNTPQRQDITRAHRYVRTALSSMLANDIHLPTSQFRWLKGIDRTLWYALHSADTQSVFVEGAGVLAQMRFERKAQAEGLTLQMDFVDLAIDGLQLDLEGIGLVHEHRKSVKTPISKEMDWKPATLTDTTFLSADEAMTAAHAPDEVQSDNLVQNDKVAPVTENVPAATSEDIRTPSQDQTQDWTVDEYDDAEMQSLQDQYSYAFADELPATPSPIKPSPRRDSSSERDDDDFDAF